MAEYSPLVLKYNSEVVPNVKMSVFKQIWSVVIVFFYLYNFPLNYFGLPFSSSKFIIILGVFHFCLNPTNVSRLLKNKFYRKLLWLTLFTLGYMFLFQFVIHSSFTYYKYGYIVSLFYIECFIGSLYIINFIKRFDIVTLINLLIVVCLIQSMIMVIAIGAPGIKHFVFSVLDSAPALKERI